MITELEVWRRAQLLVRRHGSGAPAEATKRADECFESDDADGWAMWRRIRAAAEELLRRDPTPREHVH